MEKSPPRKKFYQCMFVLYPESQQDIIDYCQQYLPCAWALHDKDTFENDDPNGNYKKGDLKKPHVHFVCRFPNQRYLSAIAKDLGVSENVINRCNNLFKAYVYLWHRDTPDKYQYDADIVGVNDDFVIPSESGVSQEESAQIETLLSMPVDVMQTTADMLRWAFDNGCWSAFKSNYAIWRDIRAEVKGFK